MKFRMAKNSLFAILLRSPWWMSMLVAAAVFAALRLALAPAYAAFAALPFLAIGLVAGWRQLRAPSAVRAAGVLQALRAMSWDDFSGALEDAFRRDGYAVSRLPGPDVDFELTRSGRVSLVGCRRWKIARAGVEPLRALDAARRAREAHECIYIAAGEISDNARAFAAQKSIRLPDGAELAKLLPRVTAE